MFLLISEKEPLGRATGGGTRMDKAREAKMLVDTKTLVEVNGHLYVLLRKKVLEHGGISFIIR